MFMCGILQDINDCVNADAMKFAFWTKSTSAHKINKRGATLNLVIAFLQSKKNKKQTKKKTLNIAYLEFPLWLSGNKHDQYP